MKKFKCLVLSLLVFLTFGLDVNASSMSIWANATSVKVGNKVTISVKISDVGGEFKVTSSDSSVLSGGTSSKWLENDTYTFSFEAKKVGSATITVSTIDAATTDAKVFTGSKSVTLNVVSSNTGGGASSGSSNGGGNTTADKKEYSSNNNLSKLEIEGYDLTPKFSKDVTEYKLTVDQSVETIKINTKLEDNKASVSGDGERNLSMGENTIDIKVTAENGNDKIYKIKVLVEDLNPIKVKIDKKEYTIVKKNNDLIEKLENFEETTLKIDDQDVVAYLNPNTKVNLVILKDEDNKLDYYVYNAHNNSYEIYRYIDINGINLQLLDSNKELENFKKYEITIHEESVDIYKIKKSHKVGLIYGVNTANGNTGYYVYDKNEDTLSKYYDEEIAIYKEENVKLRNIIMILIGSFSFLVIVWLGFSLFRKRRKKHRF